MSEAPSRSRWSRDEYLAWEPAQPLRYELVGGAVHAMGGGTADHDTIANNLRGELRAQLRGTPCRVNGPDLKVLAGEDARYPDALIDCGPRMPGASHAQQPVAVFEVLSRTTAWIDQTLKLRAYDATPSIQLYALISQDEPRVLLYRRDAQGQLSIGGAALLEGMDAAIEVPVPGVRVTLAALYEGAGG